MSSLDAYLTTLTRPLVFTNGCFDILHRGHIAYLEEAAALGHSLIIGVNSDDSVRRLNKGPGRPINILEDRMVVLAGLACVDAVIAFEEDTPLKLIQHIKPDHLVKGGDWAIKDIVGAEDVINHGGHVHSIPFRYQRSTSALVEKLRST